MVRLFVLLSIPLACTTSFAEESYPIQTVKTKCPPGYADKQSKAGTTEGNSALRECAVSEFGKFGRVEGEDYFYATYCLIPQNAGPGKCGDGSFTAQYYKQRAVAVFSQSPGAKSVRLVIKERDDDPGLFVYQPPQLVKSGAQTILWIWKGYDGTGHLNASKYYARKNHRWSSIESEVWAKVLKAKAPAGLSVNKGLWPDLANMTALAPLYKKDDANCCPSGGRLRAQLAIDQDRFVVKSVAIEPSPK